MSFDWLSSATEIGVDTETKDPHLRSKGPGVFRKDGYVVGVSLATKEKAVYLDIAHPDTTPERKERNLRIIKDILANPRARLEPTSYTILTGSLTTWALKSKGRLKISNMLSR